MEDQETDESQMSSGFTTATPTGTPAPAVEKVEAKEAVPAVAAPAEAEDPMKVFQDRLDKYQQSYDKLAGTVGRIKQTNEELKAQLAAAQAATKTVDDAPSKSQITEAVKDPEKWAALKNQYKDWAEATEEVIDARIARAGGQVDQAAIDKRVAELVAGETASVRTEMINSHLDSIVDGNWLEVAKSDGFRNFLTSSPGWIPEATDADAAIPTLSDPNSKLSIAIKNDPNGILALAFSPKMTDAAKMFRMYEASKRTQSAQAQAPQAPQVSTRQKRLEAAVAPRGSGGHGAAPNEKDEMSSGFYGKQTT